MNARPAPPATMVPLAIPTLWALRGDAAHASFAEEAARRFGAALPTRPCTSAQAGTVTLLWTGPRAWLVLDATPDSRDYEGARRAFADSGGALFDVSAAYAWWQLRGHGAATALAALCPLDLHPRAFTPGACAGSMLGHVAALVYRPQGDEGFRVAVARSLARDAEDALQAAVASVNASTA